MSMEPSKALLVLGSSSVHRRSVMERRFRPGSYEMDSPDIDEKAIRRETPEELTLAISNAKVDALASRHSGRNAILICGDQVVRFEGRVLEVSPASLHSRMDFYHMQKPVSADEGREMLRGYARGPPETVSSVVVLHLPTGRRAQGVEYTKVFLRPFPEDVIEAVLSEGTVFSCCGSFAIEQPLIVPYVERIEGDPNAVKGLPLGLLIRLMGEIGWVEEEEEEANRDSPS